VKECPFESVGALLIATEKARERGTYSGTRGYDNMRPTSPEKAIKGRRTLIYHSIRRLSKQFVHWETNNIKSDRTRKNCIDTIKQAIMKIRTSREEALERCVDREDWHRCV